MKLFKEHRELVFGAIALLFAVSVWIWMIRDFVTKVSIPELIVGTEYMVERRWFSVVGARWLVLIGLTILALTLFRDSGYDEKKDRSPRVLSQPLVGIGLIVAGAVVRYLA